MAPHSSTLAWKIIWMEEPGRLQSIGLRRVRHNWATSLLLSFHALEKEMASHSSVLAWRIPGTAEPGGLPSMGSHRVGHDWSDLAAAAAVTKLPIHLKLYKLTLSQWLRRYKVYWDLYNIFVKFCLWLSWNGKRVCLGKNKSVGILLWDQR